MVDLAVTVAFLKHVKIHRLRPGRYYLAAVCSLPMECLLSFCLEDVLIATVVSSWNPSIYSDMALAIRLRAVFAG